MKPLAYRPHKPLMPLLLVEVLVLMICPVLAQSQINRSPDVQPGHPRAALISPGWAPFGSTISEQRIPAYNRATYQIGTSGPLSREGVIEAKRVGFVTILDLQSSPEKSRAERLMAEYANIGYSNLPITGDLPSQQQILQFANSVQDPRNLPILVHGDSSDQVGAIWALYRAALGVPAQIAVVDGITAGLGPSLSAVQSRLGLPMQQQ